MLERLADDVVRVGMACHRSTELQKKPLGYFLGWLAPAHML